MSIRIVKHVCPLFVPSHITVEGQPYLTFFLNSPQDRWLNALWPSVKVDPSLAVLCVSMSSLLEESRRRESRRGDRASGQEIQQSSISAARSTNIE